MDRHADRLGKASPAGALEKACPGVVATGFVPDRVAAAYPAIAPGIPLRRVATAEDVARAVLACATLLAYSTGSTVLVDGGRAL